MNNSDVRTVRICSRAWSQFALLGVLEHEKIWERVGLDAHVTHIPLAREADQALMDGALDFIFGSHVSPYRQRALGVPFIYLGQTVNYTVDSIAATFPIRHLKELEGRRLATEPLYDDKGGLYSHPRGNLLIYLEREGADRNRITFVESATESPEAALQAGKADAAFISRSGASKLTKADLSVLDLEPLPMVNSITVTTLSPNVNKDPERVTRILKALILGIHTFKTNRERTLQILRDHVASKLKIKTEQDLQRVYGVTAERLEVKPYPRLDAIQNAYRIAVMMYPETASVNPLSLWDLHYVRELDESGFIDNLYQKETR
jgi:ABC-type nitrate/sulfonate/bicarbonate transport system substrate-binding protein